jgi:ethanolamine ammonia-lyase small subunit
MRKLDKAEVDRIKQISDDIRYKVTDLIVAHGLAATAFEQKLRPALDAYNQAVRAASNYIEDIHEAQMPTLTEFEEIVYGNIADSLDQLLEPDDA